MLERKNTKRIKMAIATSVDDKIFMNKYISDIIRLSSIILDIANNDKYLLIKLTIKQINLVKVKIKFP